MKFSALGGPSRSTRTNEFAVLLQAMSVTLKASALSTSPEPRTKPRKSRPPTPIASHMTAMRRPLSRSFPSAATWPDASYSSA